MRLVAIYLQMMSWRSFALLRVGVLAGLLVLAGGEKAVPQSRPDCPIPPASLAAMHDCYRPLLVFSAGRRDTAFTRQQALLDEYADEMLDRYVLYVPVLPESSHFEPPLDAPYALLPTPGNAALRRRFRIAEGEFAVVLLGEDGKEKLRSRKPISVLALDQLIDLMPGRRQEAEQKRKPSRSSH